MTDMIQICFYRYNLYSPYWQLTPHPREFSVFDSYSGIPQFLTVTISEDEFSRLSHENQYSTWHLNQALTDYELTKLQIDDYNNHIDRLKGLK